MGERQYQSESIAKLAEALAKAQGAFDHAKKDVKNEFFKSKYADLASVIDGAKKPLAENGLAVIQTTDFDQAGNMHLYTILAHSSGEWIGGRYPINPVKPDPQALGSATTYARRYAFSAITGIAAEDDDGNGAAGHNRQQTPKPETAKARNERFAAIKKAILEADDPAAVWHEHLSEINGFKAQDQQFYDDLVAAGSARRAELDKLAAASGAHTKRQTVDSLMDDAEYLRT